MGRRWAVQQPCESKWNRSELMTKPGLGKLLRRHIAALRSAHGPWRSESFVMGYAPARVSRSATGCMCVPPVAGRSRLLRFAFVLSSFHDGTALQSNERCTAFWSLKVGVVPTADSTYTRRRPNDVQSAGHNAHRDDRDKYERLRAESVAHHR